MRNYLCSFVGGALAFFIPITGFAENGPSFYCKEKKLTETELAICADTYSLPQYDRALAFLYRGLMDSTAEDDLKNGFIKSQRDWLKRRNGCGDDKDCISKRYAERISFLLKSSDGLISKSKKILNSKLYTFFRMPQGLGGYRVPDCHKFPDINLDGQAEIICAQLCGATHCEALMFASNDRKYDLLNEFELGASGLTVAENNIPNEIIDIPDFSHNLTVKGWKILVLYRSISECEASYTYMVFDGIKYKNVYEYSYRTTEILYCHE